VNADRKKAKDEALIKAKADHKKAKDEALIKANADRKRIKDRALAKAKADRKNAKAEASKSYILIKQRRKELEKELDTLRQVESREKKCLKRKHTKRKPTKRKVHHRKRAKVILFILIYIICDYIHIYIYISYV
jgi:Flp pilus assembly protein TadB